MTEKKTSFVLPTDLLDDLEDFSDDEVGKIFRAILIYTNEAEEPEFDDRAMKVVFRHIKKYIDSANENYDKKVQANRVNGAKGGRPKKDAEENPKNQRLLKKPNGFRKNPTKAILRLSLRLRLILRLCLSVSVRLRLIMSLCLSVSVRLSLTAFHTRTRKATAKIKMSCSVTKNMSV